MQFTPVFPTVLEVFIISDRADMNLMYSVANGNIRETFQICEECFPNTSMFDQLHRQVGTNGLFITSSAVSGRSRIERYASLEETIVKFVDSPQVQQLLNVL
ncbi:hypothetical protein NPIL_519031 [Nephila pilipes]|uniref:Uncharacterized protein n=1 Tax=Nephila pilipes TaxID=299642 RepID=A0A8X6P776_NEPPI|nr:hypothetical protein NPIL_519031 [Nephila pilipes]